MFNLAVYDRPTKFYKKGKALQRELFTVVVSEERGCNDFSFVQRDG